MNTQESLGPLKPTRRGFFARLMAAPIVALVALRATPVDAKKLYGWARFEGQITYKGIPFAYDEQCPPNRIYAMNQGEGMRFYYSELERASR